MGNISTIFLEGCLKQKFLVIAISPLIILLCKSEGRNLWSWWVSVKIRTSAFNRTQTINIHLIAISCNYDSSELHLEISLGMLVCRYGSCCHYWSCDGIIMWWNFLWSTLPMILYYELWCDNAHHPYFSISPWHLLIIRSSWGFLICAGCEEESWWGWNQ